MAAVEVHLTQLQETQKERLITMLYKMKVSNIMCDIEIECGANKLAAHRCVLAATSSYFNSLFTVDPSWTDPGYEQPLKVPVDSHTMELLLEYMYTGTLTITAVTLPSVLVASHLLRLSDVYNYCLAEARNIIDMNNFTRLWKAGEKCGNGLLLDEVIAYSCDNISWLTNQSAISRCSPSHLSAIFECGQLTADEAIKVLFLWLNHDLNSRQHDVPRLVKRLTNITHDQLKCALETKSYSAQSHITKLILEHFETSTQVNHKLAKCKIIAIPQSEENIAEGKPLLAPTKKSCVLPSQKTPSLPPRKQCPTNLMGEVTNARQPTLPVTGAAENTQLHLKDGMEQVQTPAIRDNAPTNEIEREAPHFLVFAVTKSNELAMQKYNLATKCWSAPTEFPLPDQYCMLPIITVLDNRVCTLGGCTTDFSASVYSTCIPKLAQTKCCSMLLPRVHFGVVSLNDLLYAIGGRNKTGWLRDVERYDPGQDVWHQMAPLSEAKSALAVTVMHGRIYVVGGLSAAKTFTKSTECYNPSSDQWTQLMPLSLGRYRMGIGAMDNRVFVLGGSKEKELASTDNFLVYETDQNVWRSIASPQVFMDDQPCIIAWNHKLWIISRRNFNLFSYQPEINSWTKLETSNSVQKWKFVKNVVYMNIPHSGTE